MLYNMNLSDFFKEYPRIAIAFSGGVDSAYLLYTAIQNGADVCAYYVKSVFQPQFELLDAKRMAEDIGAKLKILTVDILAQPEVSENPCDRCYYCKKAIFTAICEAVQKDGYEVLLDGTNASDEEGERPGMRALQELKVLSPLRLCGLTKSAIRSRSKDAGLFTWNKPAYACLATRITTGETITAEKLRTTERAEDYLFSLGFTDFRVRMQGETAKLQISEEQFSLLLLHRTEIYTELKKYYKSILLDMEARTRT